MGLSFHDKLFETERHFQNFVFDETRMYKRVYLKSLNQKKIYSKEIHQISFKLHLEDKINLKV